MEFSNTSSVMVLALTASILLLSVVPVYGQINNQCTPTMLSTFTPCMNFLTNSSANVSSPSADCCNSLKNLTSGGMNCVCLIVTGSVPFRIPINRTLAMSLPRACNMPSVPLQCKAAGGAPIPAPGPISIPPTLSPGVSPSLSPTGSVVPEPTPSAEAPDSGTPPSLTPPSSTATTGSGADLTPSAANPSYGFSPFLLAFTLGFIVVLKYY